MIQLSSMSYESDLRQFEAVEASQQSSPEEVAVREEIAEGVRDGIRSVGMSSSAIHLIDDNSVDNHDGTITAGVFNRMNGKIGLASVDSLMETIDPDVSNLQERVRDQVEATLYHEQRHQKSCENAKARGEFGMIAAYLGNEADRLFQELMASKGTEEFDAYDADRAKAISLASQIGLSGPEVIQLVYEGREKEIVLAALESGYLQPELN